MKLLLILCALIALSNARSFSFYRRKVHFSDASLNDWHQFKLDYGKTYIDAIDEYVRMKIFMERREMVLKHNYKFEIGEKSHTLQITENSDLTLTEVAKKFK